MKKKPGIAEIFSLLNFATICNDSSNLLEQWGWWFLKMYVRILKKRDQHNTWIISTCRLFFGKNKSWHSSLIFSYVHSFIRRICFTNFCLPLRPFTCGGLRLVAKYFWRVRKNCCNRHDLSLAAWKRSLFKNLMALKKIKLTLKKNKNAMLKNRQCIYANGKGVINSLLNLRSAVHRISQVGNNLTSTWCLQRVLNVWEKVYVKKWVVALDIAYVQHVPQQLLSRLWFLCNRWYTKLQNHIVNDCSSFSSNGLYCLSQNSLTLHFFPRKQSFEAIFN